MISPRALVRTARRPALPHPTWDPRVPARLRGWQHLPAIHVLWLIVWASWWVGNDMPPPESPRSRQPSMSEYPDGSAGAWILDQLDDLRFRFGLTWAVALLLRGAWLGGVIGIGWIVLAQLTDVPAPTIIQLLPFVIGGALLGLVLRLFHRPTYRHVARMLDATFALRSRVSTAVTGLRYDDGTSGGLHDLQLADAANAVARSRALISREQWLPVREIFLACIVAVVLLFLLIAQRPVEEIAPISATGIPGFVPVSERLAEAEQQQLVPPEIPDAATLQEVEDISRDSNQARQDLNEIGEALQGNSVTSPAGDSVESGEYPEANEQLSESASEVANLPEADRQRLADELDEAAEQVSGDNPELAESAQDAVDDVRSGEDTGALDELGDQIEETGESVVSRGSSDGELSESPSESSSSGSPSGGGSEQSGGEQAPQNGQSEQGAPGAAPAGDPGSGMAASGGVGSSDEPGTSSEGAGSPGENGQAGGQAADAPPGTSGDTPGEGGDTSSSSDSAGGQTSEATNGGSMTGGPDEEGEDASQGSGAGGGQQNANDPNEPSDSDSGGGSDLDNEDQAPEAGEGEAGDPPPGGGDEDGETTTTESPGTNASISLPGTSDERVRSGSDIGSSSVGSGGGVGAASGDSTGGASGSSGPDPNAVPEDWRTVVEDYFRDGGAP